jgi:signal transduction histidine kinase
MLSGVVRTHSAFGTLPLLAGLFVLPLPMALALSGYDAFELPRDLRRVLLGGAAAAGIASLGVTLFAGAAWAVRGSSSADHWQLLGAAVSCLGVAEVSRRIARPASSWLDPASGAFEQRLARFASATLRDEHAVARDLMALLRVLPFRRGELFALGSRAPERRAQFGAAPDGSTSWVRTALDLVGTDLRAELWRFSAARRAAARALLDREVDLVLALRHADQTLGIVLLAAESGRPPSRAHVALAETACAHAATAIANARLAEELVALERRAATGRAALALAHDLGKELDWIRHLATALPDRLADRGRVRRDLDTIAVLATERAQALRGLVRRARDGAAARSATLAELIGEAATRARRRLCSISLHCTIDRDVCDLPVHGDLSFVIDELLDNAVRAAPHLPVEVRASRRGDRLRVVVSDRGIGLDPSWSPRAFEPGFTTRGPDGCGMGLAIVRDTVRSLGGEIALAPGADRGTSFCVDLPCG